MGAIQKRTNKDGTVTYQARVRRLGLGQRLATFNRKCDAQDWIREEEEKAKLSIHMPNVQAE